MQKLFIMTLTLFLVAPVSNAQNDKSGGSSAKGSEASRSCLKSFNSFDCIESLRQEQDQKILEKVLAAAEKHCLGSTEKNQTEILCTQLGSYLFSKQEAARGEEVLKHDCSINFASCLALSGYYYDFADKKQALAIAKERCAKDNPLWVYLDEKVDQKDSACNTITSKGVLPENYLAIARESLNSIGWASDKVSSAPTAIADSAVKVAKSRLPANAEP